MKLIVIGCTFSLAVASTVAWLIWGPLLNFLLALVPNANPWSGLAKIVLYAIVAYFGGIGLPIVILVFGCALSITLEK